MGDTRVAQLVGRVATDGTCELYLMLGFTVGCGKVNCPKGKRRCPGMRPRRTICKFICTRAIVGEHSVLPHHRQPDAENNIAAA